MNFSNIANWIVVLLSIISLIGITYTSTLITSFSSPESTANFLQDAHTYEHLSEIIKKDIQNRYPEDLQSNLVQLAAANAILNFAVTPEIVQRLSLPLLKTQARVSKLPLDVNQTSVVLNTEKYTQNLQDNLSGLDLPPAINDASQKLVNSIPSQITLVDQQNPNPILSIVTRLRIFFDNAQTLHIISWLVFIPSILVLIFLNRKNWNLLLASFVWILGIAGVVLLGLSFLTPAVTAAIPASPDPVTGALKNTMINDIVIHYFELTRNLGLIYLLLALVFYLIQRYAIPTKK